MTMNGADRRMQHGSQVGGLDYWTADFGRVECCKRHPHVEVTLTRERLTANEALALAYALRDAHDKSVVSTGRAVSERSPTSCSDCGSEVGAPHQDGCDVARCTACGWQRISCEHGDSDLGWGQVWSGEWPGYVECCEFGLWVRWVDRVTGEPRPFSFLAAGTWQKCSRDDLGAVEDLNELARLAAAGEVVWDGARWQRPPLGGAT